MGGGGVWSVSSTPSNRLSDFGNWIVGEQYFGKINEVFQSGDDILPIYSRQDAENTPPSPVNIKRGSLSGNHWLKLD
jgi:hypothetical protein